MTDTTTPPSEPDQPLGLSCNEQLGQASEALTADEVRRAAFELCEFIEDIVDKPTDTPEAARFKAGQRYAAKTIRKGLGIWFVDEENRRKA